MSTRSCIARLKSKDKFTGIYHHWDGYPTALGATLFELYNGHFKKDLPAMLRAIIDAHPAGYSTINGTDFSMPAGYGDDNKYAKDKDGKNDYSKPLPHGPVCFCHGERSEKAQKITEKDDAGMEWAYVFDEKKNLMLVFERLYADNAGPAAGKHMVGMFGMGADGKQYWALAATVDLNGAEPDWEKVTAQKEAA